MVTLRPSRADEAPAIREILQAAFPTAAEADLVDALRTDGDILLEWVAVAEGRIVGVIQYSPLRLIDDGSEISAVALAPVAVQPDLQGQGIGGRLIETTLGELRQTDLAAAVVLGHPDYYPRFGFSAALAAERLNDPFDAGAAFMALELGGAGLPAGRSDVRYAPAFGMSR